MLVSQQVGSSITPLQWQPFCSSAASLGDLKFQLQHFPKKGSHRHLKPQLAEWMLDRLDTF